MSVTLPVEGRPGVRPIGGKVVLLAEDDAAQQKLFRHALQQSGVECQLEVVQDGVELIDYLFCTGQYKSRDRRAMPDLILLDLRMPRMDGLQVLQVMHRVRDEQLRFPPVVVLTSSEREEDVLDAYRWGARSFIRKPVSFPEFAEAVRETAQYWLALNRPPPRPRVGAYATPHVL